jgi:topoisomerase IV subunit A
LGGRGHGEPVRLFVDIEQESDPVSVFPAVGGRKFLVASREGRGLHRSRGRMHSQHPQAQDPQLTMPDEACAVSVADGELVAAIGENRKMLVFPLEQVPEMARGRGVRLQR